MTLIHRSALCRAAIVQLLQARGDFLVEERESLAEAEAADDDRPGRHPEPGDRQKTDILLVEALLPGVRELTAGADPLSGEPPIVLIGDAETVPLPLLMSGAAGFIPGDLPPHTLAHALYAVADGAAVLPRTSLRDLLLRAPVAARRPDPDAPDSALSRLSSREHQVLALLGGGLSNSQIARRLALRPGTVKAYISSIYAKCDIASRVEAALVAHGLPAPHSESVGP
ncbi:response regulator transcription factor [Streptomyces coacervatus]|uniref:response regulator transcription factor n=1 Tax=Streptomyces coacervatus TaxID=647381 RepID=UPI0023D97D25|nr:response regulator transcription factor [Streptomyces coacervatus]MDF2267206.1 response regulator transcription factor [Streptomyces coacervatus]